MDVRWLDDFLAVLACRSFTHAALHRGVSQSALSRRIQVLEEWVGAPLFDRHAQPLRLTVTGRRFASMAARLRSMLDAAQEPEPPRINRRPQAVTIAASDGLEAGVLPQLLGRLRHECPGTALRVVGHHEQHALASLLSGRALLWVVAQDPQTPVDLMPELFHAKLVARDRLMAVMGTRDGRPLFELPGTAQRPVPVVDYADTHPLAASLNQRLARERVLPHLQVAGIAASMGALRALVAEGLGLGMVYESMVGHELRAGELLCAQPRWTTPVEVLMVRPRHLLRSSPLARRANALWDRTAELPEDPRHPPATSAARTALLVSDVVS